MFDNVLFSVFAFYRVIFVVGDPEKSHKLQTSHLPANIHRDELVA